MKKISDLRQAYDQLDAILSSHEEMARKVAESCNDSLGRVYRSYLPDSDEYLPDYDRGRYNQIVAEGVEFEVRVCGCCGPDKYILSWNVLEEFEKGELIPRKEKEIADRLQKREEAKAVERAKEEEADRAKELRQLAELKAKYEK
jgi:hypothetical protein